MPGTTVDDLTRLIEAARTGDTSFDLDRLAVNAPAFSFLRETVAPQHLAVTEARIARSGDSSITLSGALVLPDIGATELTVAFTPEEDGLAASVDVELAVPLAWNPGLPFVLSVAGFSFFSWPDFPFALAVRMQLEGDGEPLPLTLRLPGSDGEWGFYAESVHVPVTTKRLVELTGFREMDKAFPYPLQGVVLTDLALAYRPGEALSFVGVAFAWPDRFTLLPGAHLDGAHARIVVSDPFEQRQRTIDLDLAGWAHIGDQPVLLEARSRGGDGTAWTFRGTLNDVSPTPLGDLVQDLLGQDLAGLGLTLPPGFTDSLTFTGAQISISKQGDDYAFDLAATAGNLGQVAVGVVKNSGTWGFVAGFDLPDDWKISEVGKALHPNPLSTLDDLKFSGLCLVLSSFSDPAFSLTGFKLPPGATGVSKGLNFYGTLHLEGPGLGEVGTLLNKKSLPVHGALGDLASTELQANLGEDFPLIPKQVVLKSFALTLRPKPFSVNVNSDADVTIQNQALPEFSVAAGVGGGALDLSFATKAPWQDPFGVKGLTLQGVGLDLKTAPELSVGVRGEVQVGKDDSVRLACDFIGGEPDLLDGEFRGTLTLRELMKALITVDTAALAGISLSNFTIYLVANPLGVTIAGKTYKPGVALNGKLSFYGANAQVAVEVDKQQGFAFAIKEEIGPVQWDVRAALRNEKFDAFGSIIAGVTGSIGPIYVPDTKIKLADAIRLDTSVSGSFQLDLGPTKLYATLGKTTPLNFQWKSHKLSLGRPLSIELSPTSLGNPAEHIFSQIQSKASELFGALFKNIAGDAQKAAAMLANDFNQGANEAAKVLQGMGHQSDAVAKALVSTFHCSQDQVTDALHSAGYTANEVNNAVGGAFNTAGQAVGQAASTVADTAKQTADKAGDAVKHAAGTVANTAKKGAETVKHTASSVGNKIKQGWKKLFG